MKYSRIAEHIKATWVFEQLHTTRENQLRMKTGTLRLAFEKQSTVGAKQSSQTAYTDTVWYPTSGM